MTIAGGRTAVLVAAVLGAVLGLPAAGAGAVPWPRPASPRPITAGPVGPSSTYNTLTSVSADSASDAWAVGSYVNNRTGVRDTLILHWNGTAWSRVASPNPGTRFNVLNGVSAGGAKNVWAVGFYRTQAPGALPLILHWNGTAWSQVTAPASGMPQTELNGVSTVSGRNAWAAGFAGKPAVGQFATLLLHWNGTAWAQVKSASPAPTGRYNLLNGVSAIGHGHAWAVGNNPQSTTGPGQTLVLQWNGTF